jgi:hypothetical protein
MDGHTTRIARTVLEQIQSEYREMPGLALTATQAARLVATPVRDALLALDRLVQAGFLRRSELGLYLKA